MAVTNEATDDTDAPTDASDVATDAPDEPAAAAVQEGSHFENKAVMMMMRACAWMMTSFLPNCNFAKFVKIH